MTYRLRNIVIAACLAVLAAFLTALYVSSYQRQVDEGQEKVPVFVAKKDIAPGTPVSEAFGRFEEREVIRDDVVPGAVSDRSLLAGQFTSQWIYAGEQVTTRRFAEARQVGLRTELSGNLRAIQVEGNQHQLLAGLLRAGDRVDLVANLKISPDKDVFGSRVVLRNLKVLKAPQAGGVDAKLTSPDGGLSVVLAVTDSQVQKLFFVTSKHDWSLQLRPVAEAVDSPESLATLPSVLRDGLRSGTSGGN